MSSGFSPELSINSLASAFDSNKIIDKATFDDPHQYAIGVDFVLVNGTIVVEKGNHNGNRPGRILFGPGYRKNK